MGAGAIKSSSWSERQRAERNGTKSEISWCPFITHKRGPRDWKKTSEKSPHRCHRFLEKTMLNSDGGEKVDTAP